MTLAGSIPPAFASLSPELLAALQATAMTEGKHLVSIILGGTFPGLREPEPITLEEQELRFIDFLVEDALAELALTM